MATTRAAPERDWDALRREIGAKVRALRTQRLWTQAELAQRLALSQARLSEIERGLGSFSAEHLLELFRLFNVDASYFGSAPPESASQLQNALARLGARHLVESERVLPSQRIAEAHDVIVEVLVDTKNPRLLTALAPVLVARVDELQLDVVASRLEPLGLSHRLYWLIDNTLAAIKKVLEDKLPIQRARELRRAQVVLETWLEPRLSKKKATRKDVLDPTIRSQATLKDVERARSTLSRRWGIVSLLAVDDFVTAIREAA